MYLFATLQKSKKAEKAKNKKMTIISDMGKIHVTEPNRQMQKEAPVLKEKKQ
jgi:hypothetical protein